MAYITDGRRLLTPEEYYSELIFKWKVGLFLIGFVVAGIVVHAAMPEDWSKIAKFALIVSSGMIGGTSLSHFAKEIEALSGWAVRLGAVCLIGYGIWSVL